MSLSRDETINRIKTALKKRSGKTWSVTGGKGTAWGWITIDAPPKRRKFDDDGNPKEEFGYMSPEERAELGRLLGKDRPAHCQGESIPASSDYRQEYVDRAEGKTPSVFGVQYWD